MRQSRALSQQLQCPKCDCARQILALKPKLRVSRVSPHATQGILNAPFCDRRDRQHAPDPPQQGLGRNRLRDPGQGRVHEPGPVGQGPRRPVHHPRRRTARAAEAGRRHRRGHGRQYRHRADAGRQGAGLPHRHRHSRHAEPGEEGHDQAARRRADRGAGRALQEPQQLRETVGPAGRADGADRSRTARSGPTSSTMSPTATAISAPRRRKSGTRPAARSTVSSRRSAPAARWPASPSG